jgi:hypothetical protein
MSINFNEKYNFKIGDHVVLDKDFRNSSIVEIILIGRLFARVKSLGSDD